MILNKHKDLLKLLETIPVFKGLDKKSYNQIIPLLVPIKYPPNSLVIKKGDMGDSMFIIKSGVVTVNSESLSLGELSDGAFFGELSLIDNLPRSADINTKEECEIFKLTRHDFDNLLDKNSEIARTFYKNCLTETFSRFRNIITNFTYSEDLLQKKSAQLDVLDEDLSHAQKIQRDFIKINDYSAESDILGGIKFSSIYKPCIAIGGDFLNFLKFDENSAGIIIADVEGHGITASLGTGVLKSAVSIIFKQLGDKPARFMRFLNKHFNDVLNELYATSYYAFIHSDTSKITLTKAGHHQPIFWKNSESTFIEIKNSGSGLGLKRDSIYSENTIEIEKGDKILFYTDGIEEQVNNDIVMYGDERLRNKFRELIENKEEKIVEKLYQDLKTYAQGRDFDDDITIFLIEI